MKPYAIQNFQSPSGQIASSRGLRPGDGSLVEEISGAQAAITPVADAVYQCGTLTSLTISNPPAVGAWTVIFFSGETPTVTTIPTSVAGMERFAAEANTRYEINVLDGHALWHGWANPSD